MLIVRSPQEQLLQVALLISDNARWCHIQPFIHTKRAQRQRKNESKTEKNDEQGAATPLRSHNPWHHLPPVPKAPSHQAADSMYLLQSRCKQGPNCWSSRIDRASKSHTLTDALLPYTPQHAAPEFHGNSPEGGAGAPAPPPKPSRSGRPWAHLVPFPTKCIQG